MTDLPDYSREDAWRSGYDDWKSHNPADDYPEEEEVPMNEELESGDFGAEVGELD